MSGSGRGNPSGRGSANVFRQLIGSGEVEVEVGLKTERRRWSSDHMGDVSVFLRADSGPTFTQRKGVTDPYRPCVHRGGPDMHLP